MTGGHQDDRGRMTKGGHSDGKVVRASGAYPYAPAERAARPYRPLSLILHNKHTLWIDDSSIGNLARLAGNDVHTTLETF